MPPVRGGDWHTHADNKKALASQCPWLKTAYIVSGSTGQVEGSSKACGYLGLRDDLKACGADDDSKVKSSNSQRRPGCLNSGVQDWSIGG